jgi:organic hydroperoxide reductase OsmC/OhrA
MAHICNLCGREMIEVSDIMLRGLSIRGWRCECGNIHAHPDDLDLAARYYDAKGVACGGSWRAEIEGRDNITITTLEWIRDLEFKVAFDSAIDAFVMDEPPPQGKGRGPNPTRLLSAAVGYCLSGNLLFCLQKAGIEVKDIKTVISASIARNPSGRWRVSEIVVKIKPFCRNADKEKLQECINRFQEFSIIGQSVRSGIDVKVIVEGNIIKENNQGEAKENSQGE